MASSKLLALSLLLAASVAAYALLARGDAPTAGTTAAAATSDDGAPLARVLDADTQITLPEGFDAEIVYTVPPEQGSWVAMAFDPKGRLIVSDQDSQGVFRVTLPAVGAKDAAVRVESLPGFPYDPIPWGKRTVGGALGFLWAFDSLYMSSMKGFFRIRDTDGDDAFDEFTKIRDLEMGYEHSAHSIVLTEDGKGLYLVSGNHSRPPAGTRSLQPQVWREDSLLPTLPDPTGHAVGIEPPAGWICRISPDATIVQSLPSTSRSTAKASCSPSTPTWSSTSAARGTARRASTT